MPAIVYKLKDGTRVPSVTSCCKQLGWGSEGLVRWANRQGLDGLSLDDARRPAADVGTIVHAMIQAHGRGEPIDLSRVPKELMLGVDTSFAAYLEWSNLNVGKVLSAEQPLVSEVHRYGGTHDRVFIDAQGFVCLPDFKTGAQVYHEHLMQVRAYGELWNEHHPEQPIKRYYLVRVGRESGAIDTFIRAADRLEPAWDAFLLARKLYDLERKVGAVMR